MTNWTERLLEAIDRLTSHGDLPNIPGSKLILTVDVDELERLAAEARTALAQPEPVGVGLSDEEVLDLADDCGLEKQEITTWDGESRTVDHGWECTDAQLVTFATALIARYARPTIEPVPVSERFEFSVFNSEYEEQAGGTAPTYAQALSEGQHYLSQYSQDGPHSGPHSLEIRRVEVLPHNALPVPGAEEGRA